MYLSKIYKISNIILISLIFFLLTQAFDQSFGWGLNKMYPKVYFFTFGTQSEGWSEIIWFENGFIEIIQALLLFFTIIILLKFYFFSYNKKSHLIKKFIILEILGLSYFLLEEISWGQHFLNFETFNFFLDKNNFLFNHQSETNLHNTSRIFNEFPRILVIIWCSLSIFIFQLLKLNQHYDFSIIVIPNKNLVFISYLLLIFILPDLIITKLGMIDHSKLHIVEDGIFERYNFNMMIKIILSFNFLRLSELQEMLFAYYFFWHSIFLKDFYSIENKKKIKP